MIEMEQATIAGLGPIWMPKHRAERPQRPWWEAARLHSMHHYLTPEDRVLDIGTEEGDMSALIATWVDTIFLVEPNPKAWPWIEATFNANFPAPLFSRRVAGWWMGLLGSEGQDSDPSPSEWGEHFEWHDPRERPRWPVGVGEPVPDHGFFHLAEHRPVSPCITVDHLMEYTDWTPTAITIDVEGGEYHVLAGMRDTILRHRPKIWMSVHPEMLKDLYDQTAELVYQLMEDLGYDRVYLATDHESHEMFLPKEMGWRY